MSATLAGLYGLTRDARRCIFNALTRWQMDKNSLPQKRNDAAQDDASQ